MNVPLLATKLYNPKIKANWVKRPRLIEKLNKGLERKLSLVSAPAGFGKTSLVSAWLAASEVQSAWLSLDENDGNVARFLTYFVAALQTIDTTLGKEALLMLKSPQAPPTEAVVTMLVNDMTKLSTSFIFVLDDYHVIDSKEVDNALSFLIEHQPPNLHLAITTREDPQLPLPRLRVRDEITELRSSELRFSKNEVSNFLNNAMGLELSVEAITMLETRTEGWIAGLQMAALSMQGLSDTARFIQAFTGSHRFVLDYLLEEVLQQQPNEIQTFLLQTSILERLNASLCDAVTNQEDSQKILERLERNNLFMIALDDERRWFRYHHLFSEVLQARLKNDQVNLNDLHLRASHWYQENGFVMQAIQSAVAAQDPQRVANLIEQNWLVIRKNRQEIVVLSWLKTLPDKLLKTRPVLSTIYAVVLLNRREYEQADIRLQAAEVWLDATEASQMTVVNDAQFRSLTAMISNARAHHAQALGDVNASIVHAEKALELLEEKDDYERATTASLLGLAYWAKGDLSAAERSMAGGLKIFEKSKHYLITVGASVMLAHLMMLQGKLHKAKKTHRQAISFVNQQAETNAQGAVNLYRGLTELHYWGLSELYYHWGNLEMAKQVLAEGENLSTQAYAANVEHHYLIAKARLEDAEGNIARALELLSKAEQLYEQGPVPDVRPVAAMRARLWIKQGNLQTALVWAHEQKLTSHDELSYLLEFQHITLVRLLIAQFKKEKDQRYLDEASDLLMRLLTEAENDRAASAIEILILQALTLEAKGDTAAALTALQEALTLAEPEGYIQMFVNEGEPIARLIKDIAKRTKPSNHLRQLQVACKSTQKASTQATMTSSMLEPLSERELDVLKMLRTELSGPDIARHLGVSLNTIRTHTKNIYSKLDVNNRRAAINRAGELELL